MPQNLVTYECHVHSSVGQKGNVTYYVHNQVSGGKLKKHKDLETELYKQTLTWKGHALNNSYKTSPRMEKEIKKKAPKTDRGDQQLINWTSPTGNKETGKH